MSKVGWQLYPLLKYRDFYGSGNPTLTVYLAKYFFKSVFCFLFSVFWLQKILFFRLSKDYKKNFGNCIFVTAITIRFGLLLSRIICWKNIQSHFFSEFLILSLYIDRVPSFHYKLKDIFCFLMQIYHIRQYCIDQ